jgi:hypothetical protein
MAHYAFLDNNNIVTEVITGRDEHDLVEGIASWEEHYSSFRNGQRCIRTSYNGNIRKQLAQVGGVYNEELDIFINKKPYSSWVLSETNDWVSPVEHPMDAIYEWNEETISWVKVREFSSSDFVGNGQQPEVLEEFID